MNSRNVPGIALGPLNDLGGFYFFNLRTGSRINGFEWTKLPIDQEEIDRVNELGIEDGMEPYRGDLEFEYDQMDTNYADDDSVDSDDEELYDDDPPLQDEELRSEKV